MHIAWLQHTAATVDTAASAAAEARQGQLTKPPGSLGRFEELAVCLAGLQGREKPALERIHISVFAADHGVADEGVSAFPQAVTVEMIRNFCRGGAAIAVLARELGADFEVVDVGAVSDPGSLSGLVSGRVAGGTENFCLQAAMSEEQLAAALNVGRDAARRASAARAQLFIGGEMGIGNTTAATALASVYLDLASGDLVGPGTGLDDTGIRHKTGVIERAVALHREHADSSMEVLRRLGGFEIAALAGAYVACAQAGVPVLVDGFIATSAALAATRLNPGIRPWLLFAHASAEPGHRAMMSALGADPLLDLGLRLGEGSGAAAAVPLLRAACALHRGMATFAEAGVSEGP